MAIPASAYANLALVPKPAAKATKPRAPEVAAKRDAELHLKRKLEQANTILNRLEARLEAKASAIRCLQKSKNMTAARIERIEDRFLNGMIAARVEKLSGLTTVFTTRQNAASLMIDDDSLIPDQYIRETLTSAPDKVAIKAALARDEEVPGCHLEVSVSLIRK
jgi:hypothetical protein